MTDNQSLISAALYDGEIYGEHNADTELQYYRNEAELYKSEIFNLAGNVYKISGQCIDMVGKGCSNELDRDYIVRITDVVNIKTGEQRGDDWLHFYFKESLPVIPLGLKFWFNDNVWLVFNTDTTTKTVSNCIVHRCNLLLRKKDSNGNVVSEPCFMTSYKTIQNRIYQTDGTNITNPEDTIVVQFNDFTKTIKVNDRFIFGEGKFAQAWRIKSAVPFLRGRTYDNDSRTIIAFVAERTEIKATDDIHNGIADNADYYTSEDINKSENTATDADVNAFEILFSIDGGIFSINQYSSKTLTVSVKNKSAGISSFEICNADFSFSNVPENRFEIISTKDTSCEIRCLAPNPTPLQVDFNCDIKAGEEIMHLSKTAKIQLNGNL